MLISYYVLKLLPEVADMIDGVLKMMRKELLKTPVKYFFITPLIFFVIFAICFGTLLLLHTGTYKIFILYQTIVIIAL
jgi:uncharacterized membrane protein